MRKAIGPITFVIVFMLTIPALAHQNGDYKDKFDSIGWGGSDGSLSWSGPWQEIGDDNDEKFGSVRVVSSGNCKSGNCIGISALTTLLGPIGASRNADTSVFEEAELRFNLKATASMLGSQLLVQVNEGGGWVTVADYDLGAAQTDHPTIDITEYRSEDFSLRFQFTGVLLSSDVFIDNVEISGELIEATSTTTSTTVVTTTSTTEGGGAQPTTTTTRPNSTTTTTHVTTTRPTSNGSTPVGGSSSTSTTVAGTTTSSTGNDGTAATLIVAAGDELPPGPGGPPEGSGLRQTARGLQADFDGGLFGQVNAISPITGVDFQARFSMAVEVIKASWVWFVLLALVISWSIVSGMERRRTQLLD
jgi:hypothetical protein